MSSLANKKVQFIRACVFILRKTFMPCFGPTLKNNASGGQRVEAERRQVSHTIMQETMICHITTVHNCILPKAC